MTNTRDVTRYKGHKVPKDPDCTFILCYAVIQLNVDQHNPRVKKPMTFAEFKNNQRTLNAGEDFPPEFLEEIYDNIKEREIVLPEERQGALAADFKWQVRDCHFLLCSALLSSPLLSST